MKTAFSKDEIQAAFDRIRPHIKRTPVMTSGAINEIVQTSLFFKCENFQKVGAFKFRGATNAVLSLSDTELQKGVGTHSSGNHAQALALAARQAGTQAYIVMPSNAPAVKKAAVKGYGAEITFCEPTLEARERTMEQVLARTGATFIHPYDNVQVIRGQASAALELMEEVPDLDIIIAPVGGGGLLSGTALAVHYFKPEIEVVGGEPENADDAFRSFRDGKLKPSLNPDTLADGLLTSLSPMTFDIIQDHVSQIVTCSEKSLVEAMRYIWERMKIIVEPSSAVPLATILEGNLDVKGQKVGIIISGGNVDLAKLPF